MKHSMISAFLGVALLASAGSAQAATRSFFINGSDLLVGGGGSSAYPLGIILPDGGFSSVFANFTLPLDYMAGSTVVLRVKLEGGGTSCNVTLRAFGSDRLRVGKTHSFVPGPASGFTITTPGTFSTPAVASQVFAKDFKLKPATSGPVLGQKPGDSFFIIIARDGGAVSDTCGGSLALTSVKITYVTP